MSFEKNLCVLCELCVSVLKKNQHKGTKDTGILYRLFTFYVKIDSPSK